MTIWEHPVLNRLFSSYFPPTGDCDPLTLEVIKDVCKEIGRVDIVNELNRWTLWKAKGLRQTWFLKRWWKEGNYHTVEQACNCRNSKEIKCTTFCRTGINGLKAAAEQVLATKIKEALLKL